MRETHQPAASCTPPTGDLAGPPTGDLAGPQPRYVPGLGIEPATFQCVGQR